MTGFYAQWLRSYAQNDLEPGIKEYLRRCAAEIERLHAAQASPDLVEDEIVTRAQLDALAAEVAQLQRRVEFDESHFQSVERDLGASRQNDNKLAARITTLEKWRQTLADVFDNQR